MTRKETKRVKAEREKRQGERRRRLALLFYSTSKTSFLSFLREPEKKFRSQSQD